MLTQGDWNVGYNSGVKSRLLLQSDVVSIPLLSWMAAVGCLVLDMRSLEVMVMGH